MTPRPRFSLRQLVMAVAGVAVLLGVMAWGARTGVSWWASQALQCSIYLFPEFTWATGGTTFLAFVLLIADRRVRRVRSLWLLSPLVVPAALLAFGIAFRHFPGDGVADTTIEQRRMIAEWFPWLLVPVGIVLAGCFRSLSYWLIIGCIMTASLWLTFGSGLMSAMAVSNVWL